MNHTMTQPATRSSLNLFLMMVCGAMIGAGLMFLFDPAGGARRRSLMRGKTGRCVRRTGRVLQRKTQDLRNRVKGVVSEASTALRHEPVDDLRLYERIRAAIGRTVSHPRSIHVNVNDGCV